MAILDNIKNIFVKPQEIKKVKEAPVVYYNSLGVDYQQKTRYDQLATEVIQKMLLLKNVLI